MEAAFGRNKNVAEIVIQSTAMKLFVGIDGGGSKTECVVANESDILGRFTAGTCKISRVGKEAATASLRAAVQGAFYAAKNASTMPFSIHAWASQALRSPACPSGPNRRSGASCLAA